MKILHSPKVNKNKIIKIGSMQIILTVGCTWKKNIITITTPKEIIILNPHTNILEKSRINFGIYIFVIIPRLLLIKFTLLVRHLEKKLHIVKPIKMKIGKYCSDALNTTPKITV